jgi:hypothetical protein
MNLWRIRFAARAMSNHSATFAPPLPDFLPPDADAGPVVPPVVAPGGPIVTPPLRSVRCGCWLLSYRPSGTPLVAFDGTLRVECHSAGRTASGDLYQRRVIFLPPPANSE